MGTPVLLIQQQLIHQVKTNENDVVEKIKELNDLYKSGALTKEEFTKLKKELLN